MDENNWNMQLTKTEAKTIAGLRNKGYAVVLWNPVELGDAEPTEVEDRVVETGNDIIETLNQNADAQREYLKENGI